MPSESDETLYGWAAEVLGQRRGQRFCAEATSGLDCKLSFRAVALRFAFLKRKHLICHFRRVVSDRIKMNVNLRLVWELQFGLDWEKAIGIAFVVVVECANDVDASR